MPFVPDDFAVPQGFTGPGFHLEPLGPQHNERDHEAWMTSIDHIRATPGFPRGDWPYPMGLDENLSDLERHGADFAARTGFTYSILDGDEVIGCVYIYPSPDPDHDASIGMWVRASRADMDPAIRLTLAAWFSDVWPFEHPDYATTSD